MYHVSLADKATWIFTGDRKKAINRLVIIGFAAVDAEYIVTALTHTTDKD